MRSMPHIPMSHPFGESAEQPLVRTRNKYASQEAREAITRVNAQIRARKHVKPA